jgi:magnesium-transporting ATPase (P-type)
MEALKRRESIEEAAEERLAIFGHNKLEEEKGRNSLSFLGFMRNPLSWVMEVVAIMAFLTPKAKVFRDGRWSEHDVAIRVLVMLSVSNFDILYQLILVFLKDIHSKLTSLHLSMSPFWSRKALEMVFTLVQLANREKLKQFSLTLMSIHYLGRLFILLIPPTKWATSKRS